MWLKCVRVSSMSYLNGYMVFPSHQVGSLIQHIEYNSASL
jgi:hypothetical protein